MGSSGSSMGIRIPNAILALASPNRNPRIALGETPARLARATASAAESTGAS